MLGEVAREQVMLLLSPLDELQDQPPNEDRKGVGQPAGGLVVGTRLCQIARGGCVSQDRTPD